MPALCGFQTWSVALLGFEIGIPGSNKPIQIPHPQIVQEQEENIFGQVAGKQRKLF